MKITQEVDVAGVGVGPSNLSLAALLHHRTNRISAFFDAQENINWHPGMLYPESLLQVSYLKDLVTLVDPSNPFSFLCFLSSKDRLYRFINAQYSSVKRKEFESYFRWVANQLPNIYLGQKVREIGFKNNVFEIRSTDKKADAKNIVLGTGLVPKIPDCTRPYIGDTVFHIKNYLDKSLDASNKRIAIIGGGQSGAELFSHLLSQSDGLPEKLYWVSSRNNFSPIDDSSFANEYFTPGFSNYFYHLSSEEKNKMVSEQTLASDGISESLLQKIYQQLYELEFLEKRDQVATLFHSSIFDGIKSSEVGWEINVNSKNKEISLDVDIVILATGFKYEVPEFLSPIKERIEFVNGNYKINEDYSISWDGPKENRIYVQNAARLERGVADPNLSLMAWRSAMIVNSLIGEKVYKTSEADKFMSF